MRRYLEVKNSPLHGKGLFAKKALPADVVLGTCKTKKTKEPGLYTLTFDDGSQLDVTCKLKYINHSKQANVIYYDDLSVMTLRDIEAGEELLHDYGEEWS